MTTVVSSFSIMSEIVDISYYNEMEDDYKDQMSMIEILLQRNLDDHVKEMCQLWVEKLKNCEESEYFMRNQYMLLLYCYLKYSKFNSNLPFNTIPPEGPLQPLGSEFNFEEIFNDAVILGKIPNSEGVYTSDEELNLETISNRMISDLLLNEEDEELLDERINDESKNFTEEELIDLKSNTLSDEEGGKKSDGVSKNNFEVNFLNEGNKTPIENGVLEVEYENSKTKAKPKSVRFSDEESINVSKASVKTKLKQKKSFLSKLACIPSKNTLLDEDIAESKPRKIKTESEDSIIEELSVSDWDEHKIKEFLKMQLKLFKQIQIENEEKITMLRDILSEIKSRSETEIQN